MEERAKLLPRNSRPNLAGAISLAGALVENCVFIKHFGCVCVCEREIFVVFFADTQTVL